MVLAKPEPIVVDEERARRKADRARVRMEKFVRMEALRVRLSDLKEERAQLAEAIQLAAMAHRERQSQPLRLRTDSPSVEQPPDANVSASEADGHGDAAVAMDQEMPDKSAVDALDEDGKVAVASYNPNAAVGKSCLRDSKTVAEEVCLRF